MWPLSLCRGSINELSPSLLEHGEARDDEDKVMLAGPVVAGVGMLPCLLLLPMGSWMWGETTAETRSVNKQPTSGDEVSDAEEASDGDDADDSRMEGSMERDASAPDDGLP